MKSFIILSVFLAMASAANYGRAKQPFQAPRQQYKPPQPNYSQNQYHSSGAEIPILRQDSNIDPSGQYSYSFEAANGIQIAESGVGGQQAQGSAAWTAPDGTPVQISYVADENGYQPSSDQIPTPPPIPDAIARALEYIRTHPSYEDQQPYQQQQYRAAAPPKSNYNRNAFGQQKKNIYG
ncbi:endocuticle structural glycoprotein SgAbd-2-like [Condylostylus longicornis]|uniref:endocuticle structural glycoprotein SgAbd-2-like n=1 Tax=Condylostylus longicornis TaxID=2530218 RepID=UPI00244E5816|nr:endocuticle structural glycoprotein SgAbd-2-like [Condylostylus longicornis]